MLEKCIHTISCFEYVPENHAGEKVKRIGPGMTSFNTIFREESHIIIYSGFDSFDYMN